MINLNLKFPLGGRRRAAHETQGTLSKAVMRLIDDADRLRDQAQSVAAASLYAAALDIEPSRHDIRVQYGNMLKDSGSAQQAVAEYTRVLQFRNDDGDVYHQRGRAYLMMNEPGRARSDFEYAVSAGLDVPELALLGTTTAHRAHGNTDLATVYQVIAESSLFDRAYYRFSVPDLQEGVDEIQHYIDQGSQHFCNPSREFDAAIYYAQDPESRVSGVAALANALLRGNPEIGRRVEGKRVRWSSDVGTPDLIINLERLRAESFSFRYALLEERDSKKHLIYAASSFLASAGSSQGVPAVSIIIPVYGQTLWCLNCLDSLATHRSRYPFEVIVYDDASPALDMTDALQQIPFIRYIRGEQNLGFLKACNAAVPHALGEFVVLLNSDTRVCEGWLDELIGTFDLMPQAGLVGSKLLYGDGSLQEAGCIVWQDGSAWNYGRNDDPNDPRYCFARQVDYCSGAAIAIRRKVWDDLGGFDTHFAPAYYEDVDLAFRVKKAGLQVWYQPLARVLHYEGKTHGTDVNNGGKAYQTLNEKKFLERWKKTLSGNRPNGTQPMAEADRLAPMRILAIDAETPTPDRDAGSVMTIRLLQILQRLGWRVTFVPAHDRRYSDPYTDNLARMGIESVNMPAFGSVADLVHSRPGFYSMVLGFRVTVLSDLMPLLRSVYPAAKILFHDIDLHYLRMEREAAITESIGMRLDAESMKIRELKLCAEVDCTIVPSVEEKKIIKDEIGADNVVVYSYTSDVVASPPLNAGRRHIAFVGGFRHVPNIDAVQYFVRNIWPDLLKRLDDDVKFYVIGPSAPIELVNLGTDRIIFTGYQESLSPVLDTCRVFVAPLRFGAGLKGKVVTALSHGVPCVASGIAIEGMGLQPDRHVVVADDATKFAEAVHALFLDDRLWASLRQEGRDFVDRTYSWGAGESVAKDAIDIGGRVWSARQLAEVRRQVNVIQQELAAQALISSRPVTSASA